MKVKVYVEGGGDQNRTLTECRKAFHQLFDRCCGDGPKPGFVACGGRASAYKAFRIALSKDEDHYSVLLVDSEEPVDKRRGNWEHLKRRAGDNWDRPEAAVDSQAQLMVQCMESWFLADVPELESYYGQNFSVNRLPQNPNIEEVPKAAICSALEESTKDTSKGKYHKTRHGFEILGRIDFQEVCAKSPAARAFREHVLTKLGE